MALDPVLLPVLLTALGCGGAAFASAPRLRTLAGQRSRWLGTPGYVLLAAVAGAGAAATSHGLLELVAYAVLALACVALVLVDLAVLRLPDPILGRAYVAFFLLITLAAVSEGAWGRLGRALAAAFVLLVAYYLLAVARRSGLGLGDVKLAGLLGGGLGWLGWSETFLGALAAFALGAVCTALLLVTRRVSRSGELPFGPWMVFGAVVGAALAGPVLA